MNNKLPEKLTLLRKYYGLSQGEVAQALDIPVTEYMNWENGNSICAIYELRILAELFRVPVQALVDNTKIISVASPDPEETDQLEQAKTSQFAKPDNTLLSGVSSSAPTAELPVDEATKTIDTLQFQGTDMNEIVDVLPEQEATVTMQSTIPAEVIREPVRKKKVKRKSVIYLSAGLIAVLVLALLGIMLGRGGKTEVSLSSLNRLALGDQFSIYIDKDENVQIRGALNNADAFEKDIVQVSAFGNFALGLKKDGTVVCSQTDFDTSDLNDAVQIAAGRTHAAVLKSNGTVACKGSTAGCEAVSEWRNIKLIRAGDDVTVGVVKDGSVLAGGNVPAALLSEAGVKDVAISGREILVLHLDGTVAAYPVGYGETSQVTGWENISDVQAGALISAGITTEGNVEISLGMLDERTSENIMRRVNKWSNIRFLAVSGNTVIAVDQSGKMYGAGDNTYHQYDVNEDDPEDLPEAEPLGTVQNINFSVSTGNINVSWDAVANADYYIVSINTSPAKEQRVSGVTTSFPASALKDGETYKITITACANNENEFAPGEPVTVEYKYNMKTIQLDSPDGLNAQLNEDGSWTFTWNKVDHADYYVFYFENGKGAKVNDPMYTVEEELTAGQTYAVKVKAVSKADQYTDSQPAEGQFRYAGIDYQVTINLHDTSGKSVKKFDVRVKGGSYTYNELVGDNVPEGYELADKLEMIDIYQKQTLNILVNEIITEEPEPSEG